MATKARHPFWLDGGYDRELVEACDYHPAHRWTLLRLGDVLEHPHDPDERHVICAGCYVPRCGSSIDPDPCVLPRHHECLHLYADGSLEGRESWPGSDKPPVSLSLVTLLPVTYDAEGMPIAIPSPSSMRGSA
jgi:hypothetical protein